MEQSFVYLTGPYSFRFSCKENGYKIHFYRARPQIVRDEESIKQLREDPFFQEVGKDGKIEGEDDDAKDEIKIDSTETRTDSSQIISMGKPAKKDKEKKAPKLSKAVKSKRA